LTGPRHLKIGSVNPILLMGGPARLLSNGGPSVEEGLATPQREARALDPMSTIFTGRATAIDTGDLSRHRVASPLRKALESKADVGDRSAEGQIAGARTPAVRAQSLAKKRTLMCGI
jgi:hypothetical protein